MMPWRDQLRLAWSKARWVIWPPDTPLWAHLVYKAGQVITVASVPLGSPWLCLAGFALILAMAFTLRWGGAR